MVNVYGVLNQSRYMPDRRDLNRVFPGSDKGSLAGRLAHIFLDEIVSKCDYGIDLHTGAIHRTNLPQIRANLDDQQTRELAEEFGVPVLLNANLRDGSLREAAVEYGVKILLYEAGEALRFDELSIRAGVKGIENILRALQMLAKNAAANAVLNLSWPIKAAGCALVPAALYATMSVLVIMCRKAPCWPPSVMLSEKLWPGW